MLEGATLADPLRIDIRGDVITGRDVFIDVNVVIVGEVTMGDRARRSGPTAISRTPRSKR